MAENKKQTDKIEKEDSISEISADIKKNLDVEKSLDDNDETTSKELVPVGKKTGKIRQLWNARPRFQDPQQKKSFGNIVKFLALLLIFTLIARGTSGATMPKVTVASVGSEEITQMIAGSGTVTAGGSHLINAPDGLTVIEVAANAGQKVEKGSKILRFDIDDAKEKYTRENATLKQLNLDLKNLLQGGTADSSAVDSARAALATAQAVLDQVTREDREAIERAQVEVNNARAAYEAALSAGNAPEGDETVPGSLDNLYKIWMDAKQNHEQVASRITAAQQTLDLAKQALAQAEKDYQEAIAKDKENGESNAIAIETKKLDIAAQKEKVDSLKKIVDSNGWLESEVKGTVVSALQVGDVTSAGTKAAEITNNSGGFNAEVTITKDEAAKIKTGLKADVFISGSSTNYYEPVSAVVTRIAPPDENGKVKVTLKLPKGDWEPGLTAEIQIIESRQMYYTCVPIAALHSSSEGYYILTVREEKTALGIEFVVAKYMVTVEAQDKNMAAIDAYIDPSEKVIVTSTKVLEAGDKVRVVDA